MKKIVLSLVICVSVSMTATNEELYLEIQNLKDELSDMKKSQNEKNEVMLEEILDSNHGDAVKYKSHGSMGKAASKVYSSNNIVSIGGYGEYRYKKYNDFKNYASSAANETRNKSEFNIVRFVPYIGFKFNDWIVMNTEIEFENGGARSDNTKNYKYAIVEFSYLDFLIDEAFAIRVGHVLVPFGLVAINHEPVSFLTTDRPMVETILIPSTWHTNGLLAYGKIDDFEYYAGVISSVDAGGFKEGRFIQQGKQGARVFSDDISFVTRGIYVLPNGLNMGASFMYGRSTASTQSRPGVPTDKSSKAEITITMLEAHVTYENRGFNIKALATYGALGGDVSKLSADISQNISDKVNGQYLTIGYDILNSFKTSHKLFALAEIEHLNMDAGAKTTNPHNNRFLEYTGGLAYFPDPKVVVKMDYKLKDYDSKASLADENSFTISTGFIF